MGQGLPRTGDEGQRVTVGHGQCEWEIRHSRDEGIRSAYEPGAFDHVSGDPVDEYCAGGSAQAEGCEYPALVLGDIRRVIADLRAQVE
jgi:hypothetical protein